MRKLFIVSLALLLTVSCHKNSDVPINVGLLVWPSYELFYLAEHNKYYNPDSINLVTFYTPSEAIRAYRTNQLDVLLLTNQLFLDMNDEELLDRIIMVIDYSSGADLLLADPEITSVKQLKGRRVAAEASALGVYVLSRILQMNGLSQEDVKFVPTDVAEQVTEYEMGNFDAVVTYEPFGSKMKTSGARELANSSMMPYEISDLVITSPAVIKGYKKQLTVLCRGFFRAKQDFLADPEKYLPILSRREEISDQEFLTVMQGLKLLDLKDNQLLFSNPDSGFYHSITMVTQKMIEYGIIKHKHDTQKMIDNSIINEIIHDAQ